jgi:hypothetical protein
MIHVHFTTTADGCAAAETAKKSRIFPLDMEIRL